MLPKTIRSGVDLMSQGNGLMSYTTLQLLCVKTPQFLPKEGKNRSEHLKKTQGPLEGHCCPIDPVSLAEVETAVDSEM